jgi:hypothetical protein
MASALALTSRLEVSDAPIFQRKEIFALEKFLHVPIAKK